MNETPLVFSTGHEQTVGILTQPEPSARRPDVGFVFTHGGARGRLSNTFGFPFIARALANDGYSSLRFDPPGLGDAAGDIGICDVREVYEKIMLGDHVEATRRAIAEFASRVNPRKLVLLGICGGASTAQLAAAACNNVDAAVLMSSPVVMVSTKTQRTADHAGYAAQQLAERYATRVWSPKAWLRLLTGQSDWGEIVKYGRAALFGTGSVLNRARHAVAERLAPRVADVAKDSPSDPVALIPGFIPSLNTFVGRGGKVLFIYGSNDWFKVQFDEEFRAKHWHKNPGYERSCDIHVVPSANHMFTLREWQRESVRKIVDWVGRL